MEIIVTYNIIKINAYLLKYHFSFVIFISQAEYNSYSHPGVSLVGVERRDF